MSDWRVPLPDVHCRRHILHKLGIKVKKYIAVEIRDDAWTMCQANNGDLGGELVRVTDIKDDEELLAALGEGVEVDLYVASPPCNDISGSNPMREVRAASRVARPSDSRPRP